VDILQRFTRKYRVDEPIACWLWQASVDKDGYGHFWMNGRNCKAHRIAFELFKGNPGNLQVLHKCDTPGCVNPDHLWLGTNTENTADRDAKGRTSRNHTKAYIGEENGRAKLTSDNVRTIRELLAQGLRQRDVAEKFGISLTLVSFIHTRKCWKTI
jgi:HNH endonuclease